MRCFLAVVIVCLLITVACTPTSPRVKRESDMFEQIAMIVNGIKSEQTYNILKRQLASYELVLQRLSSWSLDVVHDDAFYLRQKQYEKVTRQLLDVLKEILPESAHPSEAEITNLAKKFSQTLREPGFFTYNFLPEETIFTMTNQSVTNLAELFAGTPILENGNNFMAALEKKDQKLHQTAKMLLLLLDNSHEFAQHYIDKDSREVRMTDNGKAFLHYLGQFAFDYCANLLKSEETSVELFKEFALFAKVLKDPSSYENMDALFKAISSSKLLEAIALTAKYFFKYRAQVLTEEEQSEFYRCANEFLEVVKVTLANGSTTYESFIRLAALTWVQNNRRTFFALERKIADEERKRGQFQLKDYLSEDEKKLLEEVTFSSGGDPVIKEEQLNELKSKNEKLYAAVYLGNYYVQCHRRYSGFGTEADGFYKKYNTVGLELEEVIAQLPLSDERNMQILGHYKARIGELNKLSISAKKELVMAHPYYTLLYLIRLD